MRSSFTAASPGLVRTPWQHVRRTHLPPSFVLPYNCMYCLVTAMRVIHHVTLRCPCRLLPYTCMHAIDIYIGLYVYIGYIYWLHISRLIYIGDVMQCMDGTVYIYSTIHTLYHVTVTFLVRYSMQGSYRPLMLCVLRASSFTPWLLYRACSNSEYILTYLRVELV